MEPRTGGVQKQLRLILHNGKLQLVQGAGLREPADFVFLPQPFGSSLLDDGLAIRDGVELGTQTVPFHRKCAVPGNEFLQRGMKDALKQLFKGFGGETGQPQQDPFSGTQIQVGFDDIGKVPVEQDAAVFRTDVQKVHPPQLLSGDTLQSEQTGDATGKTRHNELPSHKCVFIIADKA